MQHDALKQRIKGTLRLSIDEETPWSGMWNWSVGIGKWRRRTWRQVLENDPRWLLKAAERQYAAIPEDFVEELYERALVACYSLERWAGGIVRGRTKRKRWVRRREATNRGMQILTATDLMRWNEMEPEQDARTESKIQSLRKKKISRDARIFSQVMRER